MPLCFLCKKTFSIKLLFKHFDLYHPENVSSYICGKENCSRSFSLKNSYRKHLINHKTSETV